MNNLAKLYKVMISIIKMNIVCLESWSTITKIVLKPDEEKSFLIKFIKIKFYRCSEIGSCLRDL